TATDVRSARRSARPSTPARAKAGGLLPKATSATGRSLGRRPTVPYRDRPMPLTLVALALLPGCVIVQSPGRNASRSRAIRRWSPVNIVLSKGVEAREHPVMGGRDAEDVDWSDPGRIDGGERCARSGRRCRLLYGRLRHLRSFGRCRAQHNEERHDPSRVRRSLPRLRTNLAVGGVRCPPSSGRTLHESRSPSARSGGGGSHPERRGGIAPSRPSVTTVVGTRRSPPESHRGQPAVIASESAKRELTIAAAGGRGVWVARRPA